MMINGLMICSQGFQDSISIALFKHLRLIRCQKELVLSSWSILLVLVCLFIVFFPKCID